MKSILTPLIIVISIYAGFVSTWSLIQRDKIAFYDYNKVYNECSLKKELEKDLQEVVSNRKSELDSMQLELSFLSEKIKNNQANSEETVKFEDLKNRFLTYQSKYEDENMRLKESYFAQIRKEINDKSKSYAEMHGYDYFFSAIGDGSLMYASPSDDVTDEFLKFLDNK